MAAVAAHSDAGGSSPARGHGEPTMKEPQPTHPANVSCSFDDGSCSAATEPLSCPSHHLRHSAVDHLHAGPSMTPCPPRSPLMEPPPPPPMARNRISLVQTPDGRAIWWMEPLVDGPRYEAMMRKRVTYLEEEEAARRAGASKDRLGGEHSRAEQQGGGNEAGIATGQAFSDTPPDPSAARSSRGDKRFSSRPASSTIYDLPEVSLEEEQSTAASLGTASAAVSGGAPSLPRRHDNDIPVVHLRSTSKQRAFLDFGEDNVVEKAIVRSFSVQAPSCDPTGKKFNVQLSCGEAFRIEVDGGAPGGGNDDESPAQIALREGESKLVHAIWTPLEAGCVGEVMRLQVHSEGSQWKQSVVIVGESRVASVGESDREDSEVHEYLVGEPSDFTQSNMVSAITDSMEYSQEELELDVDEEEELLLGEETLTEEKKCEENILDSGVQLKEQGTKLEEQHTAAEDSRTEDSHEKNLWSEALASLELSDIEVNDSDSQRDVGHEVLELESSEVALGEDPSQENVRVAMPLAPIDEAANSTSSELSDERGLEVPHVNTSGEQQDAGYDLPSDAEETELSDTPAVDEHDECEVRLRPSFNAQHTATEEKAVAVPSAEIPQEAFDEKENKRVLPREKKSKAGAAELEDLLALEDLVALGETDVDQELCSNESQSSDESSLLSHADKAKLPTISHRSPLVRLDQQQLQTPPLTECLVRFQSLAQESIEQDSSPESAESNDQPLAADPFLLDRGNQSPASPPLSDCLASVQDLLVNSPGRESLPSPTEELLLNYPSPERDRFDESEESLLVSMMDQDSDVDSSPEKAYDSEVLRTKEELAEFLEGVTELEEVAQRQHAYITSPTKHDFHTQLDNINKGIDAITPPSAKLNGGFSKSGVNIVSVVDAVKSLSEKKGRPRLLPASPQQETLLVPTPKKAARQCYFYKQSKGGSSSCPPKGMRAPAAEERVAQMKTADTVRSNALALSSQGGSAFVFSSGRNSFESPHCNTKKPERKSDEQTRVEATLMDHRSNSALPKPSKSDPTHLRPSTQQSLALPNDSFKTPHRSRSEKIIAIRNKLRGLTEMSSEPEALGNYEEIGPKPESAEPSRTVGTGIKKSPKEMILKLDELPNTTMSSAQKCYFYAKSPRRIAKASRFSYSGTFSTGKGTPQSPFDAPGGAEEREKQSLIFSPPALGPREKLALEKHICTVRKRRNKGDSPDDWRERSGSSPRVGTPSPREIKAYEKHIRSMRKRLGRDSPPENGHGSVRKSTAGSAYSRHIGRVKGQTSPEHPTSK
ncbi:hypothetical protein ACHAXT_005592 [Thalassiosira profunda]